MADFSNLGLKKNIVEVLRRSKYQKAFEVQEKVIPLTLQRKNVVFTSRTGSGKTLAFSLGYLNKINKKLPCQMLIIVPTRELAIQVGKELEKICTPLAINVGTLYGGRDINGDYRTLAKKNHIYVATPGRLINHIDDKRLKVGEVRYIVFDESDQMFDEGFAKDCAYFLERISSEAQIILSSATITGKVKNFMNDYVSDHVLLEIGDLVPTNIIQEKIYCEMGEKKPIILKTFQRKVKRTLIFINTKSKAYKLTEYLNDNKIKTRLLSGDLEQHERINNLNMFKQGRLPVLVSTDVAARGIHIPSVDRVINYDVPTKNEFYIHRIGRTGRKDKKGYSLTLVCPEDIERFAWIEVKYKLKIKETKIDLDLDQDSKKTNLVE